MESRQRGQPGGYESVPGVGPFLFFILSMLRFKLSGGVKSVVVFLTFVSNDLYKCRYYIYICQINIYTFC